MYQLVTLRYRLNIVVRATDSVSSPSPNQLHYGKPLEPTAMTTLLQPKQVIYPENDGQPMSENTEHYRWIVTIKENLEILYAAVADVFIAGDLLWYPVEKKDKTSEDSISAAPDVMVVFGANKGKRGSYLQWEEGNIAPQVVFEIRSPSNEKVELEKKFKFYQKHGVKEYYLYDPHTFELDGWQRQGNRLEPILIMNDWVSPLLGIRFVMTTDGLEIYRPDGRKFLSSVELERERERADRLREQAELERDDAKAQLGRLRAQLSNLSPEQLKALGLDPDLLG